MGWCRKLSARMPPVLPYKRIAEWPIWPIFADGWGRMTGIDWTLGEIFRRFRRNFALCALSAMNGRSRGDEE
jgi:hypothetical protein